MGGVFMKTMTSLVATVVLLVVILSFPAQGMERKGRSQKAREIVNSSAVKGGLIVHLGCGDGRILRKVYKQYGVKAIGYEMNPLAYVKARILSLGLKSIRIRLRNFWKVNLSNADMIFCYLYPDVMRELSKKLRKELRPGAVVVSFNFALPDWQSARVLRPGNNLHNDPIYIYGV